MMRSDFYSLPYAARRAIRQGEREADIARQRAWSIRELEAEVTRLEKELAAANETIAALRTQSGSNENVG
jgi:phage shock protein A